MLKRFAEHDATRRPQIFYNTWNYQERLFHWHKRPYLSELNEKRLLDEIDAAARMGIDVFVIDTGWYSRTGDWQVNPQRFPDGLKTIKKQLDAHGMRLGLWFDNAAAISSKALADHSECVMSKNGQTGDPQPVWETESSHRMCIVSRYADAWADEMIRLHAETGVTYFKWDAISQYGCDSPDHDHGTAEHSPQERAERFSFLLPLYMAKAASRIAAAVPGAICDFDMTESHRCVGLAFLEAGKFFLINNGPYNWDYDIPKDRVGDGNPNLFFHPGAARTWFMRYPLSYDRWIPSSLLLTHYLPDDPAENQRNAVASLVLGQHGIWGDLPAISREGQERIGQLLGKYKLVRDDATAAPPVRQGFVGGDGEVHEKLNPANGRGVVCIFAGHAGQYSYITQHRPAFPAWHGEGVEVTQLPDGRARILATFDSKDHGAMVVFGA
jgi:alpha-galactosidase